MNVCRNILKLADEICTRTWLCVLSYNWRSPREEDIKCVCGMQVVAEIEIPHTG